MRTKIRTTMSYISATHVQDKVYVWERNKDGERIITDYPAPYYFYYDDPEGVYKTVYGNPVSKFTCDTNAKFRAAKKQYADKRIGVWETDIAPEIRVLSNHYYGVPAPKLHITFFDIEVDYDPELGVTVQEMVASNPYAPINSVAIFHQWKNELVVLCVPPEEGWDEERLREGVNKAVPDVPVPSKYDLKIHVCDTERELLLRLIQEFKNSDILCGWNSDFFDMPYVAQRISRVLDEQPLDLTTTEEFNEVTKKIVLKYTQNPNQSIKQEALKHRFLRQLDFPQYGCPSFRPVPTVTGQLMGNTVDLIGRVRVDYMNLYKKYEPGERESYKLSSIADIVLVDKEGNGTLPKLEYSGNLRDLYRNDFAFFVRYNIRDTEILGGFEEKLGYVELANQICHLSTALFTHVNGTLKLAELALVNYCHHTLRRVVKNVTEPEIDRAIKGALVLYPQVGLHENFGSIDINSLYPSAIRSLNISPETIRGQFEECEWAANQIAQNTFAMLTFIPENGFKGAERDTEKYITAPANEWREMFIEKRWAVSGYGTVFDQTKQGFIPALLAEWYAMRKDYQKKKAEAQDAGNYDLAGYYDRLQYVYKIKLNSLYGALTNLYFRFYDLRMGESTTGSGRVILTHQCRKTSELLGDGYGVDFPLYGTIEDAIKAGYTLEEARPITLHGPKFNGKHQSDSVIYGDTDSTYFKTYALTPAEAILLADAIADKVNASYPDFMRETFLCTTGYDDIIKAGREIVSDRGIFVEKKRYILHLINLDGKTVDKMKIMGLDTKKTTLPAEVSANLNKFIERFLKGEAWDTVAVSIVDYKEQLINSKDITVLGLPKGVKGIEKYTTRYAEEGMDAVIPGHVAASLHYNECLVKFKDKVSIPIVTGMKIRVFYVTGKHGKFKSIALPTDSEVIPKWFLENFTVDKKAHILRLVDNPLSNILKAIGKETPSKQSLLVDSLLSF